MAPFSKLPGWLCASDTGFAGRIGSRWLFLRALGLIFFSAFYALLFQVNGLIGPQGLLPAGAYLQAVKQAEGASYFWYAPSVFWISSGTHALLAVCWAGIVASILLLGNIWPRATIGVCLIAFLSFTSTLQTFSAYQSDGMLLGAAFLCLFYAPPGLRPGWGKESHPSRASLFLLQWLFFAIYFESGMVKLLSGDPEWRHLTAMDEYYQNGPLPTWIAWYFQHLPHWFHAGTAGFTLLLELVLIWMVFLPRRFRLALFCIVTPWQIGIILTSNYAFLNYLVLALGILLLDDRYLLRPIPQRFRKREKSEPGLTEQGLTEAAASSPPCDIPAAGPRRTLGFIRLWIAVFALAWIFYATAAQMIWLVFPGAPLTRAPVEALEPFRIAERYGLFAVMTRGRYEIEFQGSNDGTSWTVYPFRYKPQDPREAPGVYAPYQPRFDWNLWFASLGTWQDNPFVISTEERLLQNSGAVLTLFKSNPFPDMPPRQVRAVLWQYWFSSPEEKRQGLWWRRNFAGLYAPVLERRDNGRIGVVTIPPSDERTLH